MYSMQRHAPRALAWAMVFIAAGAGQAPGIEVVDAVPEDADPPALAPPPPAEADADGAGAVVFPPVSAIRYTVRFEGVDDAGLLDDLRALSDTLAMRDVPPASLIHLRRRTQRDTARFVATLQALGHYGARAEADIDPEADPVAVVFAIEPGAAYTFSEVRVDAVGLDEDPPDFPDPAEYGAAAGAVATAERILAAESRLLAWLRENGYPFPEAAPRAVRVRHATGTARVVYRLRPGPRAVFGPARIEGLEAVRESVVLDMLPWSEGDPYAQAAVQAFQRRLYESGLFSLVRVEAERPEQAGAPAPVRVRVSERRHRSVSAGLEFRTDEGLGSRYTWEHRNARGLGHKLELGAELSQTAYVAEMGYGIPRFRRHDQSLQVRFRAGEYSPEAFKSRLVGGSAMVSRKLSEQLTVSAGVALRWDRVEQRRRTKSFSLLSFPALANWDRSDDPLNPTRGFRLIGHVEPFVDVLNPDTTFVKRHLTFTHYLPFGEDATWVFATRARIGMIGGGSLGDIPPSERFYAGGGGSIRGYPYQKVGPLEEGDPIGGRSLSEAALELRRRITESIGVVGFVDGGMAYNAAFPDFSARMLWGAGMGLRYFTPLGPLRVDVAVPLDRRRGIDNRFQLYISIGQAF